MEQPALHYKDPSARGSAMLPGAHSCIYGRTCHCAREFNSIPGATALPDAAVCMDLLPDPILGSAPSVAFKNIHFASVWTKLG